MSEKENLVLEILSGPLDGTTITLQGDTEWSCIGDGPLAFPWDEELGQPQARFTLDEEGWGLEGFDAPHGTYHINQGERIKDKVALEKGAILKASNTWLFVR